MHLSQFNKVMMVLMAGDERVCQMIQYGLSFIKFHSTALTSSAGNAPSASAASDTKTTVSCLMCRASVNYVCTDDVECESHEVS